MLLYDVEIERPVPDDRHRDREPGIEYCNGWKDYTGMGVAVACAWDGHENAYRVFLKDNLYELQNLIDRHSRVVGFNNHRFDDPLMRAHGVMIPDEKSYDLLTEILRANGNGRFSPNACAGYGLDAVARANLERGKGKSGSGDLAPVLWQRGCRGAVIDYCMRDVYLLKSLMDCVIGDGGLICPRSGQFIRVRGPYEDEATQIESAALPRDHQHGADGQG